MNVDSLKLINEVIVAEGGVPGELRGIPPYHLVAVGEAPGKTETRLGRPFVGQAGMVLDGLLGQSGVTSIYLTNVAKQQPPYKDGKQTAPSKVEIERWRPYLEAEIRAIDPEAIILMGKTAAKMVIEGNFSMREVVGQRQGLTLGNGQVYDTLIVLHPASFLHSQGERGNAYRMNLWKRAVSGLTAEAAPEYSIVKAECLLHEGNHHEI